MTDSEKIQMKYICQTCGNESEVKGGICTECGGMMITECQQEPKLTTREMPTLSLDEIITMQDTLNRHGIKL